MTTVNITAQVETTLAELGDTPDAIADRLRALGIKGRQHSMRFCPIARLIEPLNGVEFVEVDGRYAFLSPDIDTTDWVWLPQPVREFVSWFDDGVYLDLAEVQA